MMGRNFPELRDVINGRPPCDFGNSNTRARAGNKMNKKMVFLAPEMQKHKLNVVFKHSQFWLFTSNFRGTYLTVYLYIKP